MHSDTLLQKMTNGVALSDDDRWLWLESVKAKAMFELKSQDANAVVVSCSALRRTDIEELRRSRALGMVFVILQGTPEVLQKRASAREDQFIGE
jgi:gluconokinase